MLVSASVQMKIALLKELKETVKNDPVQNKIAKLKLKLAPQELLIEELQKELIALGIEFPDHSFTSQSGELLGSVTRNKDNFKEAKFFKDIDQSLHSVLGVKNAEKALICVQTTKGKCTSQSKTWKLKIS